MNNIYQFENFYTCTSIILHKTNNFWKITSPQYSDMNSFFSAGTLRKIPHPAISEGARRRC